MPLILLRYWATETKWDSEAGHWTSLKSKNETKSADYRITWIKWCVVLISCRQVKLSEIILLYISWTSFHFFSNLTQRIIILLSFQALLPLHISYFQQDDVEFQETLQDGKEIWEFCQCYKEGPFFHIHCWSETLLDSLGVP